MSKIHAPHSDVFFDRERLDRYLQELGGSPGQSEKESVQALLGLLQSKQLLSSERPHSLEEELHGAKLHPFANNSLWATKVTFQSGSAAGPKSISVWVSDPPALANARIPALNPGAREGCFVLLVESHWRPDPVDFYQHSGDACIDWFLDELVHAGAVSQSARDRIVFGPHPIEKLKTLGGLVAKPRQINVLYRKSRISNAAAVETTEKKFGFFTSKTRRELNDLVGHPILIGSV